MRLKAVLFAAAVLSGCASASAQTGGALDWLSGYWLSCDDGVETAENWIGAERGVLLGTNLTRGRSVSYEFLRIAPNATGGLSYYSMPEGRSPPTEFAMVSQDGQRAVFENPAHDFPQRIIYAREGDALHARIEDMSGREGVDWRFRRADADSTCLH